MAKKRFQVSMNEEYANRLEKMADDYGLTLNSCAAFIICQYLDDNSLKHELMKDVVDNFLSSPEDLFGNPDLLKMVKEILSDDKSFKNSVKNSLEQEEV